MEQNQLKKRTVSMVMFFLMLVANAFAQGGINITGTVVDDNGEPVIGASVVLKGKAGVGTVTDFDGVFKMAVPSQNSVIVISYVGMNTKEIKVGNRKNIKVVLTEDAAQLEQVVVVGYGQQKKASIVGAITQTDEKVLQKHEGISSLGQALTGNLPGLITYSSTGMPGEEEPKIIIRSQSSWNGSDPLVLVDGVERPMSSVDMSSVATISVLKDASATAVYGVKGANGVILITTKRGQEGKAVVNLKANMTMKVASKLPEEYDSYDTFILKNRVLQREFAKNGASAWAGVKPMDIINKYRYPANMEEWDRYANVDWEDVMFRNSTMSYSMNANISGGSKLVKYYAAVDYVHEGDLFRQFKNKRGYQAGYGYNRLNMRSNIDFRITGTTELSVNLFGSNGVRTTPWDGKTSDGYWSSVYQTAPDAFRPVYSDGTYGYFGPSRADAPNAVSLMANSGIEKQTTTRLNTDFILNQKLDFITKGLSFKANFSLDNSFIEAKRGIEDNNFETFPEKYVNPETGETSWNGTNGEDKQDINKWTLTAGSVQKGWPFNSPYRKIYYSLQLNYAHQFGKHDVTAMGLFSRDKYTSGSEFAHFREDWVFRTTYNYDTRYFAEVNGAYNGSEKYGPNHRFDFFPSVSVGWMLTGEKFMENVKFVDMFKFRASWGKIGDDSAGDRWLYADKWSYGGNAMMGSPLVNTPYTIYSPTQIGNPDIHWEKVEKKNFGVDFSFFNGLLAGSFDLFKDHRTDIIIGGGSQNIPSFYGFTAPTANLGETESQGYELVLRSNYVFANKMRVYANFNMTHATNKVLFADDPALKAAYRKSVGYCIDQTRTYLDQGFIRSWDDLYGSTQRISNDDAKLTGDYLIMDFNGDGIIDDNDQAPYKYSGIPQNTFSTTVGFEYKGFQISAQFYGVTNVTRAIDFPTFNRNKNIAYVEGNYYTIDGGGNIPLPRYGTTLPEGGNGTRYLYDGSYLRLKNLEIAYTFTGKFIKKCHLNALRVYLNGDNLFLWTDMPDDRENNFSSGYNSATGGAYPTMRRFNLGINVTL